MVLGFSLSGLWVSYISNGSRFGVRPRCRMALPPKAWRWGRVSHRNGQRLLCLLPPRSPRKAGVRLADSCFPLPLAFLRLRADRQDGTSRTGGRAETRAGDHPARAYRGRLVARPGEFEMK